MEISEQVAQVRGMYGSMNFFFFGDGVVLGCSGEFPTSRSI